MQIKVCAPYTVQCGRLEIKQAAIKENGEHCCGRHAGATEVYDRNPGRQEVRLSRRTSGEVQNSD